MVLFYVPDNLYLQEGTLLQNKNFRLTKAFSAVKFNGDGKGEICTLTEGSELEILGASTVQGCVEVRCTAERYNIFEQDLRANSVPVQTIPDSNE